MQGHYSYGLPRNSSAHRKGKKKQKRDVGLCSEGGDGGRGADGGDSGVDGGVDTLRTFDLSSSQFRFT